MSKNVAVENLCDSIMDELLFYGNSIVIGLDDISHKAINDLVKRTKDTAPVGKRRKHYKNSISSRKIPANRQTVTYVWYVKAPDYRLSHLLNNGHATRNGGRVKGTGFIAKAEKEVVEKFEKEIEEVIKNG